MQETIEIESGVPAPEPRVMTAQTRLTAELRALQPEQSVVVDEKTARRIRAYGRYRGWKTVQRRENGGDGMALVRVWRLE
jgi:hypothetical protein